MNGRYVHYLAGGGLGDVTRELLYNNALGILKRWKMRHPAAHLKIVTMSHNPSSEDLFFGQDWIDELSHPRFPLELGWKWEMCYEWFAEEFEGHTELRFNLPDKKSLYRIDFNAVRPKDRWPVERIDPIGMSCDIVLHQGEWVEQVWMNAGRLIVHPFGGETHKWFTPDVIRLIHERAGERALWVGADYSRMGHGTEEGKGIEIKTFKPRILIELIRRSIGVIGSESSVYYNGAMQGKPVCMLWAKNGQYELAKLKVSNWDWYFGEGEPQNLFLPLPPLMTLTESQQLSDWIDARLNG